MERRLDCYDFVTLVLDGKSFAQDEMVIALGVTVKGEKLILGFERNMKGKGFLLLSFVVILLGVNIGDSPANGPKPS